jgi:hypothetical protein
MEVFATKILVVKLVTVYQIYVNVPPLRIHTGMEQNVVSFHTFKYQNVKILFLM